ncbi:protein WVD2-like 7 [Impatiens glandulifera]|uniref:protein WVD2-like 7 n=1 Tax=Impatiens glandulifera TaxID=253017 RepID=UPI001FB09422|nr:protein WVD2-like 7 [Impatiens glandulifera]
MMSESPAACLLRSNSQPVATSTIGGFHENELMRALTSSVSFGRYASESFVSDKWTAFTSNRYLEEAKKSSKPGSVKEMKAYFDSHYKKIAANKAASLLEHPSEDSDDQIAKEEEEVAQYETGDDGLDLNREMEKQDSTFVDNENSHVLAVEEEDRANIVNSPVPPKSAVEEEEEEDKENIVKSPASFKVVVEEEEEENIVNIPVPFKKPKEDKKKKPINSFSKSSINGSKPFKPLPPPPPPPLRPSLSKSAQPKPITTNKTPLRQIKKETSTPIIKRIQKIKIDDSTPVIMKKKKTAAINLVESRLLKPNPVNKPLAQHKESSQLIAAADKGKEKKKRMLSSPTKHKMQDKKVEKKRQSFSTTITVVKKKFDSSKTQLPTINHHHQLTEKKKKSSVQELNQRPPWRFSFKSSPERKNVGGGGGAEAYPVNSMMTPRKKRIFR